MVGNERISESDLTEQVEQVLRAQGRPVDSASEALVVTTLDRMITTQLVEQLAAEKGAEALVLCKHWPDLCRGDGFEQSIVVADSKETSNTLFPALGV